MSDGESTLADQQGKFTQVVKDGDKVPDVEWIPGRILLSDKRLVLASNQGKRTIPLSKISTIKTRDDASQPFANVSSYLSLQVGNDVTLVAPNDHEEFEHELYSAVLDGEVVITKHPAVKGGVIQDTEWQKGRMAVDEDQIGLALADGKFVEVEVDDVGDLSRNRGEVLDKERLFIEVEHTVGNTAVETHISGKQRKVNILAGLLGSNQAQDPENVELSDREQEVLMALYSGVSPFQIPQFVGMDVETVEQIYDQLIEQGILEVERERREVELKARGRHVAGEAMGRE
ncbi:chemotaxis protein CheF1 [Halovenus sp. WSH3]|uniref:Taxis protein CheF n=1 Tax=Halovenus carboxidivorans TaxID=2692199 RepID=A0A6B0T8R2_9EURY|nr:CheF family chemotaxis protein [Halovenus carboxidivorans]MXR52626.1 chemotaxis protein CheF1 [Halovenus carboxidivorans]